MPACLPVCLSVCLHSTQALTRGWKTVVVQIGIQVLYSNVTRVATSKSRGQGCEVLESKAQPGNANTTVEGLTYMIFKVDRIIATNECHMLRA